MTSRRRWTSSSPTASASSNTNSGPINTNEKGIAELGDDRVAWFKDPDGNVHGVAPGLTGRDEALEAAGLSE